MVKLLACLVAAVLATPSFGDGPPETDRERKVRVALALAHVETIKVSPSPMAKGLFDWFGENAVVAAPKSKVCACCDEAKKPHPATTVVGCTCTPEKNCGSATCPGGCVTCKPVQPTGLHPAAVIPAKVATYHYETTCYTDRFGRRFCQQVLVPDEPK